MLRFKPKRKEIEMSLVDVLMESSVADTDVLRTLNSQDDDFAIPRDVDFLLKASTKKKAEIAAGFINDHQFGVATTQEHDGEYSVQVVLHMAIQQHVILSVSGFMGSVCALFGLDYDGWGCAPQVHSQAIS
jgi:hypothetical protein